MRDRFFNYRATDQGRWVRIKDPQGSAYIIRYDHLDERYWSNLHFKGLPTGFNRFAILYGDTDADLASQSFLRFGYRSPKKQSACFLLRSVVSCQ
jgi:hypothetical protein